MEPVTAVLLGAGQRGRYVYGPFAEANPHLLRFVAVAEPVVARREDFAARHHIPTERCFATWEEALAGGPRLAEACVIATDDRDHIGPTLAALAADYDVLLEKPLAADLSDTMQVAAAAAASDHLVHVAHVLRYTPFFRTLHDIVASGALGEIVTVEHRENVASWHMAHTFVRGRSNRLAVSSPMLLQKCCHDLDILQWNLPSPVRTISSVGSLLHFRPEQAPAGAPPRCTDGCPAAAECPFDAHRIYLDPAKRGFPVHVITDDLSREGRLAALRTGPYGRCVYHCDNDVVDHQVVTMQLESGASMVLVMHGHSAEEGRTMRYDGTRATLRGRFGRRQEIEVIDHATGRATDVAIPAATGGHGGGDPAMIRAFVAALREGVSSETTAAETVESHLLAFAAEAAQRDARTIDMEHFRAAALG